MKSPLVFVLLLFAKAGTAQFMPVQSTIKTPYGNVSHTTYRYMPMYNYTTGTGSARYLFTITLKNDSVITKRGRISTIRKDHTITIRENGKKRVINVFETKSISRISPTTGIISGMAADSCWLFKAVRGKITGYGYLAETGLSYVVAIQEDDGPILPLTKENLLPMVATDPKAVQLAEKNRLSKAIEVYNKNAE